MSVETGISELLEQTFQPSHMEVINESHMHSVPPNSETHFKVVLVSPNFEGVMKVKRHQQVYSALAEYMRNPIHALGLHTHSPTEWSESQAVPASPNCLGGSKSN